MDAGSDKIGRIVKSVDFERVLGSPIRARSAHFALHYLADKPSTPSGSKLSTGDAPSQSIPVDDFSVAGRWLGVVVPKRHARRSVTRTLLKRQIRSAAGSTRPGLGEGLWVVRLRAPFDRKSYPSASSEALRKVAGQELASMFADAVRRFAAS